MTLRRMGELYKTTYYEVIDGMIFCSGFYHRQPNNEGDASRLEDEYPDDYFELLRYLGA